MQLLIALMLVNKQPGFHSLDLKFMTEEAVSAVNSILHIFILVARYCDMFSVEILHTCWQTSYCWYLIELVCRISCITELCTFMPYALCTLHPALHCLLLLLYFLQWVAG